MIREGQVVLFRFPYANHTDAKLRPALLIRQLPGYHDDWLICMISSQLSQKIPSFDELVSMEDSDFIRSGLKYTSVIRICRLAVVHKAVLEGTIGEIGTDRLARIKNRLADWLKGVSPEAKYPVP